MHRSRRPADVQITLPGRGEPAGNARGLERFQHGAAGEVGIERLKGARRRSMSATGQGYALRQRATSGHEGRGDSIAARPRRGQHPTEIPCRPERDRVA
jgi:hypothetical protein